MTPSKFHITGNVSVYKLPADYTFEDYKKLENKDAFLVDKGKNLVVDAGMFQVISLMIGNNTNSFTYCGVGSGTGTPTSADTDMETAIGSRVAIRDRFRSGLEAHYETFFGKNDNNGSWEESGLFDASTGGNMLCRRKFTSTITKSSSNGYVIAWTITLAAVAD